VRIAFAISDARSVRLLAGRCSSITVPPFLGWPMAIILRRKPLTGVSFAYEIVDSGPYCFAGNSTRGRIPVVAGLRHVPATNLRLAHSPRRHGG